MRARCLRFVSRDETFYIIMTIHNSHTIANGSSHAYNKNCASTVRSTTVEMS